MDKAEAISENSQSVFDFMALCSLNCNDTPRDDGGRRSGGARGTMPYQQFDGLVDPQNSSGSVKSVSTKPTGYVYPTSMDPAIEDTGAEVTLATQDFRGLVEPISITKVTNDAIISRGPPKFSKPPRALQIFALGDPRKCLPLSNGDWKSGLTPQSIGPTIRPCRNFLSSLALKNQKNTLL